MLTKCQCRHCGQELEFEVEDHRYGLTAECPHCHQQTELKLRRWKGWNPIPNLSSAGVSESMIGLSYLSALLVPFIGFFMGIYLVTKKESGHGLTCIALSILVTAVCVILIIKM
jgi:hypothetical protein